jgi:3-hydroxyisobutyrate dehydrogenase
MRVAVLGTGIMGAAMAKNIAAAGHDVVVWNRTRERAEATGLPVAATPQEAVTGSDVALTMLRDLASVREAVNDVDFGNSVWMQSSTVGLGSRNSPPSAGRCSTRPSSGRASRRRRGS